MSKPLNVKRREAEQRIEAYNKLSVEEKLKRALKNSNGKETREVKRLKTQLQNHRGD